MVFFDDNPITLLLSLIIAIAILKAYMTNHKWFKGSKSTYIAPIIIILAILMIIYRSSLSIISYAIPLIALVTIFLFAIGAIFFMFGMPGNKILPTLKEVGMIKIGFVIVLFCIVALAGSRMYGQTLLEDKSVSLGDVLMTQEKEVEINFFNFFNQKTLGLLMLIIIVGLLMFFVIALV